MTFARSRRGIYTTLCAEVLFPLHEALKRHDTVARRRALERSQWWSPEQLERFRLRRLQNFLVRVGASVPYYAELFRNVGFDGTITSLRDLAHLPFLTKAIIRANIERLRARDAHDLRPYNTGGSSGEPLVFLIGRERTSHDVAAKWRALRWWGVDIGDPEVVVWGSPVELSAQDRLRNLRDRLLRSTLLPAFDLTEATLDRFVATLLRKRPAVVFGYPSVLALIARHSTRRGQPLADVGIRVAIVTAERLYPEQRESIAR
ncbi:MAG: hypothetical protein NZM12_14135, partial [Steroidobacteraceae bacterium]|nr:hypothetical protein [Steroidobacteraceae bacterium]